MTITGVPWRQKCVRLSKFANLMPNKCLYDSHWVKYFSKSSILFESPCILWYWQGKYTIQATNRKFCMLTYIDITSIQFLLYKLQWPLLLLRFSYILVTTTSAQCLYSNSALINKQMSSTRPCRSIANTPTTAITSQFNPLVPEFSFKF
jgi:hypothetical protein